ncbi:aminoglycoside phosphotransferase family protein [Candidatus Babeliales bacterium]|nr:aminoglycoside phosphotransferase family protein [Candidatus Babeliales bacterium]MBP9844368.1 aminoglycoside phosphotransferase family protein [Candidatus Babeliales bacterium]
MKQIIINEIIAQQLIAEQFPEFKNFEIKSIKTQGHDNRTFRLGNDLLIRLPSAQCYAAQIKKEQIWLPQFAPHISTMIPKPIKLGNPTSFYPFPWSINQWIEGESANNLTPQDLDLPIIAEQVAQFLKELAIINSEKGPNPGPENFYRGGRLGVYYNQTQAALQKLSSFFDVAPYEQLWHQAVQNGRLCDPVWIHGDMSPSNIIIEKKQLKAVIDFSGIAVGEPSCDLVMAWTFFDEASKQIFKENLDYEENIWEVARAWALWKSLITLADMQDLQTPAANTQLKILENIVNDHTAKRYFLMTPKPLRTFTINSHEKIIIELRNYYDQLHCCYFPSIYFKHYNHKYSLNQHEDARDLTEKLVTTLEQVLENKLTLPDELQDLGTIANHHYNPKDHHNYYSSKEFEERYERFQKYEILGHDYFAFLFNDMYGNIILQISPAYPLRHVRKHRKPSYNNFLHWMKTSYSPKFTRIIPKKVAEDWLDQSRQILGIIKNNIHEGFRKFPAEEEDSDQ